MRLLYMAVTGCRVFVVWLLDGIYSPGYLRCISSIGDLQMKPCAALHAGAVVNGRRTSCKSTC
jgi:hypothetical protein